MYTTSQFNKLSRAAKLSIIEQHATYLDLSRKDQQIVIRLFSLSDFYVEVYYSESKVQLVTAIGLNSHKLEPYLQKINLDEIYAAIR